MPKSSTIQSSFSVGEVSPLLYGRVDSPRYKDAMATCLNYIPTLQGPLTRRPGTKYVNGAKDATKPPVFIPFQFSATQAYILEFGDLYIRFYANNGQIVSSGNSYEYSTTSTSGFSYEVRQDTANIFGPFSSLFATITNGNPLEMQSPYKYTDVANIKFVQKADTLYLVHPNYAPAKLQRRTNYSWTLAQINLVDGPYLAYNSYAATGDSTAITLTPTSTGPTIITVRTGPSYTITGAANNGSGLIRITTFAAHGFSNGQKVHIENIVGTTEANTGPAAAKPYWQIIYVTATTFDLSGSAFVNAWASGGAAYPALFYGSTNDLQLDNGRNIALYYSGKRYPGTMSTTTNASLAQFVMTGSLPVATVADAWQLGVYNGYNQYALTPNVTTTFNGFPSCVCLHQARLVLSGCPAFPQQLDMSSTSSLESFTGSAPLTLAVTADNAIQFSLVSQDVNVIRWIKSNQQGLVAGTYNAEWVITPNNQGSAITPTNASANQSSSFGTADVDAVQSGNATIYVQRAQKKVREMNYFWQSGTFKSSDMSELSEHITAPKVIKLAIQKESQPIIWALRSDGALLSLVYDRGDSNIRAGWAKHTLGGQSDAAGTQPLILSMAVIPDPTISFDQLWIVVQRWINGAKVVTIEYMTNIYNDTILQEDSFQGDCGATYDSPLTITGISTASTAVVTSTAHGLSNGDQVRIVSVVGMNLSTTDINGNITISNLVNNKTFVIAGVAANTFQLNDFNSNPVSSSSYAAYVSGGQVRKMVLTLSGPALTVLKNETLGVLADGAIHSDVVVSNAGVVTLNYRAAKVQFGYRYNSDGQLLRTESGAADGTSIGKTRRISRVAILLHSIGDFLMGMNFSRLIPVKFQQADQQQADQATPLYSGLYRDGVESIYDFDQQFCFRQSSMLPGVVQAVTLMGEEFDV